MRPTLKKSIDHLIKVMRVYDYHYYNDKPIIPDSTYDTDYFKLQKYHHEFPNDKVITDYFAHLPQKETNSFKKVKHTSFMGSLDKIRTKAPLVSYLKKWTTNPNDLWSTDKFVIESKLDGLSGVCYFNVYPNHPFVMLTRGGGYYGNDITPEAKYLAGMNIKDVIKKVGKRRLIVRGELIMSKKSFAHLDKVTHGKYANSRNAVSGVINSKHPIDVQKAGVYLNTYTMVDRHDWRSKYPTELSQLKFLKNLGFFEDLDIHTFPNTKQGHHDLVDYCTNYTHKHRMSLNFDIDGLTIKPNNTRNFIQKVGDFQNIHKLGYNHHGPVHSKAWKFPPKAAVGIFDHVKWQPSANGRLSPVGVLRKPVHLFGSTIGKASLGSLPDAWKRDLRIGDHVLVRKMNDVIPKFVQPIKDLRTGKEHKIQIPSNATLKGQYVYMKAGQTSEAVYLQRWRKFVSKPCLNIAGLSTRTIKTLMESPNGYKQPSFLNPADFASLWNLPDKALLNLPGFGQKKLTKLNQQLSKAKSIPLSRVLLGLPIAETGGQIIKPIAQKIHDFNLYIQNWPAWKMLGQRLAKWLPTQKGFGSTSSVNVQRIFSHSIFVQLQKLTKAGLHLTEPKQKAQPKASTKLNGKHFVITGKLSKPRKYFNQQIKTNGGKVQSSVNGKTDYLICNQKSTSSKYRKAQSLNVPIINEQQFNKLL